MGTNKSSQATAFSNAVNAEIRSLMGRRSLSQTDLANSTGLSQAKVSKTIWNDVGSLTLDQLEAVCLALDVLPSDVIECAERAVLSIQVSQATDQRPGGRYNKAGEWVPETRAGYVLAAYDSDEEKGVDYDD
ncbi:helix-turn-helix domain-containing protein [Rothia sp. P4278]|uniref:helix-turn-helix domain-containing protein n=1 Tax=Rothia sp. P4278 TaxID=3402658 RepID=UPI003ADD1EBF